MENAGLDLSLFFPGSPLPQFATVSLVRINFIPTAVDGLNEFYVAVSTNLVSQRADMSLHRSGKRICVMSAWSLPRCAACNATRGILSRGDDGAWGRRAVGELPMRARTGWTGEALL